MRARRPLCSGGPASRDPQSRARLSGTCGEVGKGGAVGQPIVTTPLTAPCRWRAQAAVTPPFCSGARTALAPAAPLCRRMMLAAGQNRRRLSPPSRRRQPAALARQKSATSAPGRVVFALQPAHLSVDLVEAPPRRGQSKRHRFEPVGRSAARRWRRRHPGKARRPAGDRLPRRAAVGLPPYAGGKTDEKNQQDASEGE